MAHRVIIDYGDLNDNDLHKLVASMLLGLTGNPNFTWPVGKLLGIQEKNDEFNTRILAASTNDSVKIALKNEWRIDLLSEIHDTAQDVNRQAAGNLAKLLSSGLTLVRNRGIVGPLDSPSGFKVVNGPNPGELVCSVDAHSDAVMYFFYFAPVPAPEDIEDWKLKPSTKRKKTFRGFKSGDQIAVKAAYQGTVDELNYSETIYIYVQ